MACDRGPRSSLASRTTDPSPRTPIKNTRRTGRGFRNDHSYRARILLTGAAKTTALTPTIMPFSPRTAKSRQITRTDLVANPQDGPRSRGNQLNTPASRASELRRQVIPGEAAASHARTEIDEEP